MKYFSISFLLSLLFLTSPNLIAQETGSFEEEVDFSITTNDYPFNRTLAWYVPSDYNQNKSYKLIVGFRGGPHNSKTDFRNELKVLSSELQAIILCPDNRGHFNNEEEKVKLLFNHSVARAISIYNIDLDHIYLTGLSYGGRHAVIASLAKVSPSYKIRGVIPFAPGKNSENVPHYTSASNFPPVCVCSGTNDSNTFKSIAKRLDNRIRDNGGNSKLTEIPNVGHTTAFSKFKDVFLDCINYINSTTPTSTKSLMTLLDFPIKTYPNPTNGIINIDNDNAKEVSILSISLYRLDGSLIASYPKNIERIDVSKLSNSTIILKLITTHGVINKKIVVYN